MIDELFGSIASVAPSPSSRLPESSQVAPPLTVFLRKYDGPAAVPPPGPAFRAETTPGLLGSATRVRAALANPKLAGRQVATLLVDRYTPVDRPAKIVVEPPGGAGDTAMVLMCPP